MVAFEHCRFEGIVNFSFAVFKRSGTFVGSVFTAAAIFTEAHFSRNANFASCSFQGDCDLRNVQVSGDLLLVDEQFISPSSFGGDAVFMGVRIGGDILAAGCQFRKRTLFTKAKVEGTLILSDNASPKQTVFYGDARFDDASIKGDLRLDGAEFQGAARFARVHIGGSAFFWTGNRGNRTKFRAETYFGGLQITGDARFNGTEFDAEVDFAGLAVGAGAWFRSDRNANPTVFGAKASFFSAKISGDAWFSGAVFKGPASFLSLQIGGSLECGSDKSGRTIFRDVVEFIESEIAGSARFDGVEFMGTANFCGMRVRGTLSFDCDSAGNRVVFGGDAEFVYSRWFADAGFRGALFRGQALFTFVEAEEVFFSRNRKLSTPVSFEKGVTFDAAHFHGLTSFAHARFSGTASATFIGARFDGLVTFDSAQFRTVADFGRIDAAKAEFTGTEFVCAISFRGAHLGILSFGNPHVDQNPRRFTSPVVAELSDRAIFVAAVDLRGLVYERISVQMCELFPHIIPFDRQPYSQLESSLRKVGDDEGALKVYLERRRRERKQKFRRRTIHLWLFDWTYKSLANYGVRPFRLLAFAILILVTGALVFQRPGAVVAKIDSKPRAISLETGLEMSIRYFLPMDTPMAGDLSVAAAPVPVAIQIGHRVIVVPMNPAYYALFLRISGALLIGLGLGVLTGLLRKASP
jgi:hypothetical protein